MNKIEALNKQLAENPKLFIDVIDPQNQNYIERNMNAEMILKNHNSLNDYYKSFSVKGFKEIGIISKKSNGSSYVNKKLPIPISFEAKQPDLNSQTPSPQQIAASDNMLVESLGTGKAGKQLSLDDYIALKYMANDHKKLIEDFKELKAKHKAEKTDRKRYQKLYEEESKTSFLDTDTGKKAIGLVESLGMAFIDKASKGALAGGSQQQPTNELNGLSPDKLAFVTQVLKSPKLLDDALKNLSMVAVGLSNSDAFTAALELVLNEYELSPKE